MDGHIIGPGVVLLVGDFGFGDEVTGDAHTERAVLLDAIIKHLHIARRQNEDARSRRNHADGVPLRREVFVVVVVDVVVVHLHVAAVLFDQTRQIEHEDAARVPVSLAVVDHGVGRVFDFDARHVFVRHRIAHHDVVALPHIDARVASAVRHAVFDTHPFALHRVESVRAILLARFARPAGFYPAEGDAVHFLGFDEIAFGIFRRQVFDGDVAGVGHLDALGTLRLVGEIEDGLVHSGTANGHVVLAVEPERGGQVEVSGGQFDGAAVFDEDELFEKFFGAVGLGGERHRDQ